MTKSFSNYVTNNPKTTIQPKTQTPETKEQKENLESLVNQFQGQSQDELLQTLHNEVEKQKREGTFNLAKLEQNIEMLSPFLSDQQKKNIKELLKQI